MKKLLFILTFLFPLFAVGQTDSASKNNYDDVIFEIVEVQPSYPGGDSAMQRFIADNIVYPDSAIKKELQGRVIVQFVVEPNGSVSNVKSVKSFDKDCATEAERVIKLMKWNPGTQRGKAVRMLIPITYKLR